MTDWIADTWQIASPARWLAGPLLGKELRVASRQWKYCALRAAYVCLLALVIFLFWHSIARVGGGGSAVAQVSRLGEAGKQVIVTIVWFQFIVGQILATVLLSDAINSEVRQRTLEGLLVTPIRGFHVALGKLLSRLLQVVLLLAISLPVLAVTRVFGGVPWDYIASGLCITLAASIFAGSLSLLCSILYRHAYHAVLIAASWYLMLWGLDALVLIVMPRTSLAGNPAGAFLWSLVSPLHALFVRTQTLLAGPLPVNSCASLPAHCLTILVAAAILLTLSARRVRRVTLVAPQGELGGPTASQGGPWMAARRSWEEQAIRRVKGSPIVWKDLGTPLFLQTRSQGLLEIGLWPLAAALAVGMAALVRPTTYGSLFFAILIVQGVFFLRLGLCAAGAITREKEARTWPVLLATPLDNRTIIQGKAMGALRRNLPLMIAVLALYLLAFLCGRPGERTVPYLIVGVGMPLANLLGFSLFLTGAGLYASVTCRTTTGAVASTFGWGVFLMVISSQLPTMVLGIPGQNWSGSAFELVPVLVFVALVYGGLGLVFLVRSVRALRRNVFG